ncbi:hypothetical protein LNP25_28070 [Klebsiella variicola subsp. variicola]|nr:hypothetical protein [Klebsiella variicola subsp. variicola]
MHSLDFLSNGRSQLECGDVVAGGRGGKLRSGPASRHGTRYQRASEFIDVVARLCGSGKMARRSSIKRTDYSPMPGKVHHLDYRASTFACAARSTSLARRRAVRCWCRPALQRREKRSAAARSDMHFVFIHSIAEGWPIAKR